MNSSKKVFIGVENLRKEIFAAAILAGIILTGARSQSVQAEVLSTDSNNVTEVETSKLANNKQLTPNISMSKENQTHDSRSMVSAGETSDVNEKDLDTAKRNLDKTNKALANTQIKVTVNQEVAKNAQKELDSLNTDLTAKQADYDKADKKLMLKLITR